MSQVQQEKEVDYHQELHGLPDGWSWIPLGEICDAINGRAFKSTEWRESGVPIIRIQNLKDPEASFNYFQGELDDKHKVKAGDLLFAWSGTPGTSFGAHMWHGSDAALNQHIFNVQFDREGIDAKYFCYALNQNVSRYVAQAQGGVGLAHITKSNFMASKVPIAPLDQQKRIVAEIEKQFSRLDEAVANLKRVKANLKCYKAAVLKAAVEGRLVETEAEIARREGRSFETGAQLLQRILETRCSQWKGKGKYKEPAAPDTTDLPGLPEGWAWCGFEQVSISDKHALKAGPFGSALKKEMYVESGYKIYGQEQVISGDPTFGDYYIDESKYCELESCAVKPGDLLISLVGTAGKVLVLPPTAMPGIINPRLLKLSLNQTLIAPTYAAYMLQSVWARHYFKLQAHGGTMEILNLGIIKALPVPLPPLDEQHRIVAEVDRRLSLVREVEAQVDGNLRRAERLRQGMLSTAFEGNLLCKEVPRIFVEKAEESAA